MKKRYVISLIVVITIITSVIISKKQLIPISKAEENGLTVTYRAGSGTGETVITNQNIVDKQTQGEYDYTDNKIVLYANNSTTSDGKTISFNGGTTTYNDKTYEKVLTGWKLTAATKNGTKITQFVEPEHQNYANPEDAAKDIGTIYAQNGWYIVPEGVTAIELEAVYGRAIYIRSPFDEMYYDEYHIWYYGKNSDGTTTLDGNAIEKSSDNNFGTSETDAVATLKRAYELMSTDAGQTVYDTIFLLCGDLYEINYARTDQIMQQEQLGHIKIILVTILDIIPIVINQLQ